MTKQQAYEKATAIELAKNPIGTMQDIINTAMEIYACSKTIAKLESLYYGGNNGEAMQIHISLQKQELKKLTAV